jgi:hypothetical protein
MRAVWSFWSAPFRAHYHRLWLSEKHHLLSWVLSLGEASRHYPDTWLFTDDWGARLLVDALELPFRHVDLRLDGLRQASCDNEWWVLGKLATYAAQTMPFLHLDNDVYLWNPLPAAVTAAPVFAQNPEVFYFEDQSLYRLEPFLRGIERFGGWLPPEWLWYAQRRGNRALCCGILGGHDLDFIRHYANRAIEVIRHPGNQPVWPTLGVRDNILVEQYFLAACLEYHRQNRPLPQTGLEAAYLFPSSADAFDPECATRVGYTHLIGDAKNNRSIADSLERRVQSDYPDYYERCLAYLGRHSIPGEAGRRNAAGP